MSCKAALLGAALMLTACAASLPAPYRRARAAAERSYAHGRYDEAARHWLEAANAAERRYDRDEAHYRAAASLRRARRYDQAQALYAKLLKEPSGERTARIDFDLATLAIERGQSEHGHALLEQAIRRHPASGLARTALGRYLDWLRGQRGAEATLAWIDSARHTPALGEIGESLEYARARELERGGKLESARDAYLATAQRFPYPHGAYWDDSLYRASLIEEELGRYQAAVAHLRRMLAQRELSHLQGSYQRPRFAPAQYRIAELYRDRLGNPLTARREFRRVFSEHDTSVLRDDALWHEALLAARAGNRNAACQALGLLDSELSESRYRACAPALCTALTAPRGARCRTYIQRQLDELPPVRP